MLLIGIWKKGVEGFHPDERNPSYFTLNFYFYVCVNVFLMHFIMSILIVCSFVRLFIALICYASSEISSDIAGPRKGSSTPLKPPGTLREWLWLSAGCPTKKKMKGLHGGKRVVWQENDWSKGKDTKGTSGKISCPTKMPIAPSHLSIRHKIQDCSMMWAFGGKYVLRQIFVWESLLKAETFHTGGLWVAMCVASLLFMIMCHCTYEYWCVFVYEIRVHVSRVPQK